MAMARILVVDDALYVRADLTRLLEEHGHTVVGQAEDGRQALERFEELKPDVVTMDISMPVMDGIEALRLILLGYPDARVIMCSASKQRGNIVDALRAGARDYVIKPFDPARVIAAVEKALAAP